MLIYLNLAAVLAVTGYALYLFFQIVYSRYLFVKLGSKPDFGLNLKERINSVLVNGFGQRKLFKDKKSGLMHFILFYGFFIIQIGLIEIIIKGFIKGYEFPFGVVHKYFSFMQEWTTFLMLCAVVYAFYRRYVKDFGSKRRKGYTWRSPNDYRGNENGNNCSSSIFRSCERPFCF